MKPLPALMVLVSAAALLALVACGDDDEQPLTRPPDRSPTATATVDAEASPTATADPRLTGDPATDRVIGELVAGDWQTLDASFVLFPEPCALNPQGVGSPAPCPSGVAAGSTIQGARLMACERVYATDPAGDLPPLLEPIFANPHELYAVYRTNGGMAYNWLPRGDTAIVIGEREGPRLVDGQEWFLEDGKLVGALLGCGQTAEALVQGLDPSDFILPPPP